MLPMGILMDDLCYANKNPHTTFPAFIFKSHFRDERERGRRRNFLARLKHKSCCNYETFKKPMRSVSIALTIKSLATTGLRLKIECRNSLLNWFIGTQVLREPTDLLMLFIEADDWRVWKKQKIYERVQPRCYPFEILSDINSRCSTPFLWDYVVEKVTGFEFPIQFCYNQSNQHKSQPTNLDFCC